MPVGLYDINSASIGQNMILSAITICSHVSNGPFSYCQNMQEKTTIGGYNLIVCAMDTEDYLALITSHSLLKAENLADYYKD